MEALGGRGKKEEQKGSSLDTPCCFVLELPHRELGGACTFMKVRKSKRRAGGSFLPLLLDHGLTDKSSANTGC